MTSFSSSNDNDAEVESPARDAAEVDATNSATTPVADAPGSPDEYPMGAEIIDDVELRSRDEAARRLAMAIVRLEEERNPSRAREQIPLSFMLQLFVGASIVLAIGRAVPQGVFAGACGVIGLAWLVINAAFSIRSLRAELAWWTLMATYLIATLFAVFSR